MTLSLTTDQQSTLTGTFKDANGGVIEPDLTNPLAPQPRWTEDSKGAIVALFPAEDERTCIVVGVAPGTATVTCEDRGTGKKSVETVIVSAGGVVHIVITATAPERRALEPAPAKQELPPPPPTAGQVDTSASNPAAPKPASSFL